MAASIPADHAWPPNAGAWTCPGAVRVTHASALLTAGILATLDKRAAWRPEPLPGRAVLITDLQQALRPQHDAAVLVVDSGLTTQVVRGLLRAGVQGCVCAEGCAEELLRAVDALRSGASYVCPLSSSLLAGALKPFDLTGRESEVLALLCDGLDNRSIAERLCIALGTVKCHVKALLAKTGTSQRTALAAQAIRQGWVDRAAVAEPPPIIPPRRCSAPSPHPSR
ncbi:helix-turn-helix transcriptional regulator [Roseateles sp. BYS96W]|uniref:Response regulator transcription factor n=1 Tax=Pelomonas nitida TaxID=3299027 RepID=A0ABW7GAA2_9BURK